jgi:hypothetical protein
MDKTHDVISAFLDDEPFDGQELAAALSERAGRELLLDLVALRHLTQPAAPMAAVVPVPARRPSRLRPAFAAAAVIVAVAGGYFVGQRQGEREITAVPAATRVVEAPAAWQDVPIGRMR